ncbi:protein YIF1B-like [Pollicipes pollicipes]|uniref:protein YIF1B-like n=1 Tax=Pollicipes pollicipes TaxID=41117 RepID=UPI001884F389|nr:protein YIF1B-like [Pollicipes pollicipes]XP_037070030.1 protein YIF1B-like [Pollicipes pollicipes]XP_037070031.1 protein YIF1B-like [Pollicipes pollicipes]XP_037070032.1 protein YIF1B-like [Pollicipes pollicipes]XP_037070033.1 protein YIF1B-like [Pollicipes pollicipes]
MMAMDSMATKTAMDSMVIQEGCPIRGSMVRTRDNMVRTRDNMARVRDSTVSMEAMLATRRSSHQYAGYGYEPPPSARPQQQQQRAPPASPYGQPFPGADVLQNPMMQDMAMQYGQNVLGQGRQAVERSMEKYMSISRLKYYFAVDTAYVSRKLRLLFLPFTNSDWSVRYSSEEPIQPRHEVNAPDLYIPSMAFITYILVAGFLLGKQQRFSPEALGMQASSATAWLVFEVVVVLFTMYVMNTQTNLRTFDIIAFSGYKFVGMIITLLSSLFLDRTGYYCVLLYCSAMCALFLVRTLKVQLQPMQEDLQGGSGVKRRLYLLLLISAAQPIMMYWLTTHLVFFAPPLPAFDPLPPSAL